MRAASRAAAALYALALAIACGGSQAAVLPPSSAPPSSTPPSSAPPSSAPHVAAPAADPHGAKPDVAGADKPTSSTPREQRQALPAVAPFGAVSLRGDLSALHARGPVRFVLHGPRPSRLLEQLAASHPEARSLAHGVEVGAGALPEPIAPRHRAPSFLVDFDQEPVVALAAGLDPAPDLAALRERAAASFQKITYGTFWTASRAATLGQGDCSEHAVLLAALARARGLPARVVLGYVMLSDGERGLALGHAWTEIHDGTRWQRVDATPFGASATHYLVLGELEDEGPRFALTLMSSLSLGEIVAVEIVRDGG